MEHIKISMTPKASLSICHVTQNDNGREVSIDFEDYTLTGAEDVSLIIRKPDGTRVETALENTASNFVIWSSVPSECDTVGLANCEIKAEDNGVVLYSASFNMNIEADPYGSDVTTLTATGNPCTFTTDLADALVSLTADIVAKQDLHGYDHPWAGGAGKNKLHITATSQTINGITYTVKSDGTITANGTATAESTLVLVNGTGIFDFTTEMVLNGSVDGFGSSVRTRFGVSGVGSYDDFGNGATIPIISDISSRYSYVQITIASGTTVNNVTFKPMISTTGGDFEPYSNICPIVGHSELNLTRCGVNLFDDTCLGHYTDEILLPAGTYYFKGFITTTGTDQQNTRFYWLDDTNTWQIITASGQFDNGAITWTGSSFGWESGTFYATVTLTKPETFRMSCSNTTANTRRIGIFLTNVDTFTPYNGQTFTVAFGQTVYGGVYDKSGRLTITHGYKTYNGSENWLRHPSDTTAWFYITETVFKNQTTDIKSNMFSYNSGRWNVENSIWDIYNQIHIRPDSTISPSGQTDAGLAEFKAYLALHPLEVCVELATPIVIDVPSISVFAENGVNNIVSDCGGDVNVTYIKKV